MYCIVYAAKIMNIFSSSKGFDIYFLFLLIFFIQTMPLVPLQPFLQDEDGCSVACG